MSNGFSEGELYRTLPQLVTVRESEDSIMVKWNDGSQNIFEKNSEKHEWFRRLFIKNKEYRA